VQLRREEPDFNFNLLAGPTGGTGPVQDRAEQRTRKRRAGGTEQNPQASGVRIPGIELVKILLAVL